MNKIKETALLQSIFNVDIINYCKGDATYPKAEDHKFIVHCCNDLGLWGSGFVIAVSKRWPQPEQEYKKAIAQGASLGDIQIVKVEPDISVVNIIGQHNVKRNGEKKPIRYEALRKGFKSLHKHICDVGGSIHMPDMIGCFRAGGDRTEIVKMINEEFKGIGVYVYKLEKGKSPESMIDIDDLFE